MEHSDMKLITVNIPKAYLEDLEELVKVGMYSSRSEAIRIAVRDLIWDEFLENLNESNPKQ
jgi:Arc/MetJ-type ribon-helix-helix transcriptional regulator